MHSGTWKRREREAAKLFGSLRQIGSGSLGRAERSTSDSIHERLYVEVKCRPDHVVRGLLAEHASGISKEVAPHAVPMLMLFNPGAKLDAVTCFHSSDIPKLPGAIWHPKGVIRARDAVLTLMGDTAPKAVAEGKIPVLMLASNNRKGFVVGVRAGDMGTFKGIVATQLRKGVDE